jgi:hypothetical protein
MAENADDKNQIPDVSEMSDEDFMNMDPSVFETADDTDDDDPEAIEIARRAALTDEERAAEDQADDNDDSGTDVNDDDDDDKTEEERRTALTQEERDAEDEEDKVEETRRAALTSEERIAEDKAAEQDDNEKDKSDNKGETTDTQFAEIGKQVMAEFKANGTTIKIKSAEDAIQLMQMGANYHKKMAGLKPSLKTLKLLENNGLLDPAKLNYLIDLHQKKPEAITQLLKDSKIDPMEIDVAGKEDYVPDNRTVSDTELLLDAVLDGISDTASYNQTLTVLGDDWDSASRNTIAKNPEIIRTINAHMENGIYDQVANAVAYERSLGKLTGISDFDAYQQMGNHMHENNMFAHAAVNNQDAGDNHQDNSQSQKDIEAAKQTELRKNRRKAASPSRRKKAPVDDKSNYNPLAMSDDEFIKLNKLNL